MKEEGFERHLVIFRKYLKKQDKAEIDFSVFREKQMYDRAVS
jgi:hypothetical protein